ncbi:sensor histidine kinase [Yinghuangia sp. ASG 101]|uniref:sensor histidine kinase n=1 Tax=Yinghuangia sp. ASG 101 TaxID=2896848 RepID=UPI002F909D9B
MTALFAVEETILRFGGEVGTAPDSGGPAAAGAGADTLVIAVILALLTTVPLALAPIHLASSAVLITLASAFSLTPFHALTLAGVAAQAAVLCQLAWSGSRLLAYAPLPVFVGCAVATVGGDSLWERGIAVALVALAPAAVALGAVGRGRTTTRAHSAAAQAVADTLHEHAARGERARIARELHDVVAHHISMISVQAETARLTTQGLPAEGAKRLLAIGDTARAALTEMRRLLGVLREDAGTGGGRKPQPALDQLMELVDDARDAAGAATRLIVRGRVVQLDPGVGLTAYRIVQEALTNARRHAPGAAVDVELRYTASDLHLRIRDNGPGPGTAAPGRDRPGAAERDSRGVAVARAPETGHGLVGMRERAAMVGGELTTGAAPGGGFVVNVRLPVPAPGESA